jgi:hypothetical protein
MSLLQNKQSEGDFRCWRRKGRGAGCHFWHDAIVEVNITGAREMHATHRERIMQRWSVVQHELMPELAAEVGMLTPKLEKLIHTLEWVRIEEFVPRWHGVGRPWHDRGALANAFVAKAVLGLVTTAGLIERLMIDRALRRICGFAFWKKLPDGATFSRAFEEFAQARLAERVHEALIKEHLGQSLVGHISRDGTAIVARERPESVADTLLVQTAQVQDALLPAQALVAKEAPAPIARKRGRPRRGEVRAPKETPISRQRGQSLAQMIAELPRQCDRGSKCNGYKLHLDTADCAVPISALLTSASVHDSRAAVPLSLMSARRVTNLYDLMDAAYCSTEQREHSRTLGHVPLIDHNPRGGEKIEFDAAQALRYNERSAAERTNARLKDEFGGNAIWVKGYTKVMGHLMFGVLALSADQLMRLRQ